MTAVDDAVPIPETLPDEIKIDPGMVGVCPYLAAADGAWRSVSVAREHRCGAVAPPAPLAAEKQRRLCLTSEHRGCATFEAARAARPIVHDRATTLPRPLARMTPVVMDHGRLAVAIPSLRADHVSGQAVLVALMGLAFVAIILARLSGGGVPAGAGDASPTPNGTAGASTQTPTTTPAPVRATPAPSAPAAQSAAPGGSAAPGSPGPSTTGTSTYKVKSGDTLIGIAAKFSTTVAAIKKLNGITNASSLRVGQVLQIP